MTDYIHSKLSWPTILSRLNRQNGYEKYKACSDGNIMIARDKNRLDHREFFFKLQGSSLLIEKWIREEEKRNFIALADYEDIKENE